MVKDWTHVSQEWSKRTLMLRCTLLAGDMFKVRDQWASRAAGLILIGFLVSFKAKGTLALWKCVLEFSSHHLNTMVPKSMFLDIVIDTGCDAMDRVLEQEENWV